MDKHDKRRLESAIAWVESLGFDVLRSNRYLGNGEWDEVVTSSLHQFTGQGDYVGSTCERSNREAMVGTFSDLLTTTRSGYGYEAACLIDEVEFREAFNWPNHKLHAQAVELVEAIEALHDYPVFDEEYLSALECELIEEEIDEKLDDCWKDAAKKISQFFDLDLVPIDDHADEIKGILRGGDGDRCPHFETGCSIAWKAEKDAVSRCEEILKKWRDDVAEEIGSAGELPGADGLQLEAQDALSRIREICSTHTASYEAFEAIKQIAAILNHPRAT